MGGPEGGGAGTAGASAESSSSGGLEAGAESGAAGAGRDAAAAEAGERGPADTQASDGGASAEGNADADMAASPEGGTESGAARAGRGTPAAEAGENGPADSQASEDAEPGETAGPDKPAADDSGSPAADTADRAEAGAEPGAADAGRGTPAAEAGENGPADSQASGDGDDGASAEGDPDADTADRAEAGADQVPSAVGDAASAEQSGSDYGRNSDEPGNGDSSNLDPATSKDLAVGKPGSDGESQPGGDASSGDQDGRQQTAITHTGNDDAGQLDDAIQTGALADSKASGQPNGTPEQKPLIPYTRTDSGGLNFLSKDDLAGVRAGRNEGTPGATDVIVHANPNQFALSDGTRLSPSQMADAIRSAPDYHGGPVRLVACKAGAVDGGAAQQVADSLKQPVIAATDTVWPLPDGRLVVGSNPSAPSGQWRTFNPRE